MFCSQGSLPQIFTVDNAEIQTWFKGTTTAASMVVQKVCKRSCTESCQCHDDLNLAHMEKESSPLLCHPENSIETLKVAIED